MNKEGSENISKSVFRSISDGLIAIDQEGKVVDINVSAVYALDVAAQDVIGKHFFGSLGAPELENQLVDFFAEPDVYSVKRFEIVTSERIFVVSFDPVFSEKHDRLGVLVVMHDVTDERKLLSAKDEFIWAASHELYTPLTAIRGNLEFLASLDNLSEDVKDAIADAQNGFFRILKITQDILDTSAVETGRATFKLERFSLKEIIDKAVKEFADKEVAKNIKIITEIKADKARGDKVKVFDILTQLLDNAIKFSDDGEIVIRTYEKDKVMVDITDKGLGIPPEKVKDLFTKFGRLGTALVGHRGGTGLGLYKAKLYANGMGAVLKLKSSDLGQGSTFSLELLK